MPVETPFETEGETHEQQIARGETGVRILLALLFFVIFRLVEAVLILVVVFGLGFALVTQREPTETVKRFASRVLAYAVEIVRYLTYNDDSVPFPFREFPAAPGGDGNSG